MSLRDKAVEVLLTRESREWVEVVLLSDAEAAVEEARQPVRDIVAYIDRISDEGCPLPLVLETHLKSIKAMAVPMHSLAASAPTESAELIAVVRELHDKALSDGPYKDLLRLLADALERSERERQECHELLDELFEHPKEPPESLTIKVGKLLSDAITISGERDQLQREVARLRKEHK